MVRPTEDDSIDDGLPNPHDASSYAKLLRILNWLEDNILHATPKRRHRLRNDECERSRAELNLDHAYSILAKLEEDAAAIQTPAQRQRLQEGLRARKDTMEHISRRIQDLKHTSHEKEEDDDLECWVATGDIVDRQEEATRHGEASPSAPVLGQQTHRHDAEHTRPEAPAPEATPGLAASSAATAGNDSALPTNTRQTLRARPTHAQMTPATHSALRAALFANRRPTAAAAAAQPSTATAEALLDQQRAEQDALSDSILRMARVLKASSQSFSSTLDADKSLLGAAGKGIDKTEKGIEAARGRMGALRHMTEGRGWWGRMMLFAWVYGMMLALLLLVFVMPKLRF